jgi:fucose 4-O-acetylase-like acetyltransferase
MSTDLQPRVDAAHTGPKPQAKTRDPFFDNAKYLLIVLVVIGHNWVPAIDNFHIVKAAYMFVYAFHIPAFVLLCGYFSRSFEGRPAQWRKLATTVLVPYLIFQTAYAAVTAYTSDHPFNLHFSSPIYVCWFLLALFVWRASTPLLRSLPHPILISIIVSLAAGVTVVSTGFAFSRALQLLPFFTIGLFLQPRHFQLLRRTWVRLVAAGVLVVAFIAARLLAPDFDIRWLDRQLDAHALGVSVPIDLLFNLGLGIVALVLIAAVFALIPARHTWFSGLGVFTMYPFLLHGMVVRLLQDLDVHTNLINQGIWGMVPITLGAILLALLLTTPPVRYLTGWAVEPATLLQSRRKRAQAL